MELRHRKKPKSSGTKDPAKEDKVNDPPSPERAPRCKSSHYHETVVRKYILIFRIYQCILRLRTYLAFIRFSVEQPLNHTAYKTLVSG